MTSARSYRKPMTADDVIRIIKSESGKQFDPDVVKAFLAISERIKKNFPAG